MTTDRIEITLSEINPVILRSARNVLEPGLNTGIRMIPHYQLQYIQEGTGQITVAGIDYQVSKGMMCTWGPGIEHRIVSDVRNPLIILGAQLHLHHSLKEVHFTNFSTFPPMFVVQAQARIESLLLELAREYANQRIYWEAVTSSIARTLLLTLARQIALHENHPRAHWQTAEQIIQFIHEHYKETLTNQEIANRFHFHPSTVNKLVVEATGLSLHQYIVNLRINHAVELLHSTSMRMNEIAAAVGYPSVHYFSRIFKRKMGVPPTRLK